jgi:hypothetical protein
MDDKNELQISKQAFWDVHFEDIAGQEHEYAEWIIKRVAKYGMFEDMVGIWFYYGEEKVRQVVHSMSKIEKEMARLMIEFIG